MKATHLKDLFRRLRLSRRWVVAQFVGTLLLILMGLAWTRIPDKHGWQVGLTLLLALLLGISALELEAGTIRSLADDDGRRVKLPLCAASLLVWIAVFAASWAILDWCDDQIPLWAGYLNSRFGAGARAAMFTYDHIQRWLTVLEWVLRWIVVPAKVVPYFAVSAQWGMRIPWRRVIRMLFNWRWWLAVVLASLVGVRLPMRFFSWTPNGSVSFQVWSVVAKLTESYVLAVGCWVLLLGWLAVLFGSQLPPGEEVLAPVPALVGPPDEGREASVKLPLPDESS